MQGHDAMLKHVYTVHDNLVDQTLNKAATPQTNGHLPQSCPRMRGLSTNQQCLKWRLAQVQKGAHQTK